MLATPTPTPAHVNEVSQPKEGSFIAFLIKLALAMVVLRALVFSPFNIPSESMQPRLLIGDYLIVNKMSYGWSRYSLPFSPNLFSGRIFGSLPERGDVVVFKAPPTSRDDYIKRVIGLPGDRIRMDKGVLHLNGKVIPKQRVADFVIPVTDNMRAASGAAPCYLPVFEVKDNGGNPMCRYPQYRETLPNGVSYLTLDLMDTEMDNTYVYTVPKDHVFLMGDNRDRSADSRFPAVEGGGIGIVPVDHLVGRAQFTFFSTDGSASWLNPVSWFTATRWDRMGDGF